MSKDLPFFRFTVAEWLNDDISLEDYTTKGVFADVCAYYWFKDCSITLAKLEQRFSNAKAVLQHLLKLGILKCDSATNQVSISFLDIQKEQLLESHKNKQTAGRKGGLAKSSNATALLQQPSKQCSSYKYKDKDKENNKDKYKKNLASEKTSLAEEKDNLNEFIKLFEPVNENLQDIYPNTTERKALQELLDRHGKVILAAKIKKLTKTHGQQYCITITKPTELKKHWDRHNADLAKLEKQSTNGRASPAVSKVEIVQDDKWSKVPVYGEV